MDRELEVIRDDMEQTRANLADKLGALENQVKETVSSASEAVTTTVEGVKEVVSTVSDTVESVTDTFNIHKQVEEKPWTAMGISLAAGFVAGQLLGGSSRPEPESSRGREPCEPPRSDGRLTPYLEEEDANQQQQKEKTTDLPLLDSILPQLAGLSSSAIGTLSGLAIGSVMNVVRELVVQGLPAEWHNELKGMVDQVTRELGGKPLPPKNETAEEKDKPNDQATQPGEPKADENKSSGKQGRGKSTNGRGSRQTSSNSS